MLEYFKDPLQVAQFETKFDGDDFSWMKDYSDSQRKAYNIQQKLMQATWGWGTPGRKGMTSPR